MANAMPDVIAAAAESVTLTSDRALFTEWFYADTLIPFRYAPPEELLLSARERVAQADAETFDGTAQTFALQALHVEGVTCVTADTASQIVYAMVRDHDIERELRLQAMFIEVAQTLGDLVVLIEGEDERPHGALLG